MFGALKRAVGLSKRTPIHDIAEDENKTRENLEEELNKLDDDTRYFTVNTITNGRKSTLSLLIQGKGAVCKDITGETFNKFSLLVQYADTYNIEIFLQALEDCDTDETSRLPFLDSLIMNSKQIYMQDIVGLLDKKKVLENVDIESNLRFQLKLLERLTSEGEGMKKYITYTKNQQDIETMEGIPFIIRLDVYEFRRVKSDFGLAYDILKNVSSLMEKLNDDKKPEFKGLYENASKIVNDFLNFITIDGKEKIKTFLDKEIAFVDRRNNFYSKGERTMGGKRKQRKTKRSQNKKKRKTRRY